MTRSAWHPSGVGRSSQRARLCAADSSRGAFRAGGWRSARHPSGVGRSEQRAARPCAAPPPASTRAPGTPNPIYIYINKYMEVNVFFKNTMAIRAIPRGKCILKHIFCRYASRRASFLTWRHTSDSSHALALALSRLAARASRRNLLRPFAALAGDPKL